MLYLYEAIRELVGRPYISHYGLPMPISSSYPLRPHRPSQRPCRHGSIGTLIFSVLNDADLPVSHTPHHIGSCGPSQRVTTTADRYVLLLFRAAPASTAKKIRG